MLRNHPLPARLKPQDPAYLGNVLAALDAVGHDFIGEAPEHIAHAVQALFHSMRRGCRRLEHALQGGDFVAQLLNVRR